MPDTAAPSKTAPSPSGLGMPVPGQDCANRNTAETLRLLGEQLRPQRRVVHMGDTIYQAGERFGNLYILNSGFFKIVNLSADGREQVVGLKFRGDWLGFDGIASGRYSCDAVAMDTGEIWVVSYEALLATCVTRPDLLQVLHAADVRLHLAR